MHGLLAGANGSREIVENVAASAEARPLWQRDLAPAVLSVDQDTVGGSAQLAACAGRDGETEMRLMGRRAMGRPLWAAALGNPVMQFVAVEKIIAAIDKRRRGAVLEGQKGHRVAFCRPRRVEPSGLSAHAFDQAAAQQSYDVDLMRQLVEQDAAATRGAEFLGPPRPIEIVGVIPRRDHAEASEFSGRY